MISGHVRGTQLQFTPSGKSTHKESLDRKMDFPILPILNIKFNILALAIWDMIPEITSAVGFIYWLIQLH